MRKKCSVCKFFREHEYLRKQWEDKVNQAPSLKELSAFLDALGLRANKSTVGVHLRECEHKELYQTKLFRLKEPFKRVSNFFIKPSKEETPVGEEIPCYICKNLAKKENLIFDCMLNIYLCERCFFRRSLDKPETVTRLSTRNTQTLYEKLSEARRRSKER